MLEHYSKDLMIGLAVPFMLLPVIFVILRLWAKKLASREKRHAWDDYLVIAATLMSVTGSALQLAAAFHGHLGQHQPLNPDGTANKHDPGVIFYEETKFALDLVSPLGLGLVKMSILVYYKNIFTIPLFKYSAVAMLAIVIGWTISFFFAQVFACYPVTVFIDPYYGHKCVDQVARFLAVAISGLILDIIILAMPIPVILRLKLPLRTRIGVIGILLLGSSVVAVSISRVISLYELVENFKRHPNDVLYYTTPTFFWMNIELSLSIVSACLPTLRPIWRHFRPAAKNVSTPSSSGVPPSQRTFGSYGKFSRNKYKDLDTDTWELTHKEAMTPPEEGIVREVRISQSSDPNSSRV